MACAQVRDVVLMSHFARADETTEQMTAQQLNAFNRVTAGMTGQVSLANSAAILAWPAAHGAWVRPGIMLYGMSPLDGGPETSPPLRPVMRLESALIAVRELLPGDSIGYGSRYVCQRPVRIGVVAIGYADGYPRHAADGTPAAVKGKRTQLIGRVSMDMITVDISHIPDARVGDSVELWGNQVSANEVARCSATIAYELFTGITRRVPLQYC